MLQCWFHAFATYSKAFHAITFSLFFQPLPTCDLCRAPHQSVVVQVLRSLPACSSSKACMPSTPCHAGLETFSDALARNNLSTKSGVLSCTVARALLSRSPF